MNAGRPKKWIVKDARGRVQGPYSTRALLERISQGKVSEQEMLSRYPGGEWQPISKEPEFYDRILETLTSETDSKKTSRQDSKVIEKTRRGRAIEENDNDNFVMTPPKALPPQQPRQKVGEEEATKTDRVEKLKVSKNKKDDVIDMDDKSSILKKKKKKKAWKPIFAVALVFICVVVFLLTPSAPKGRVHLRAPLTGGTKMSNEELKKSYYNARALYFQDTFTGYWQAQNLLIRILSGHPKSKPLRSLLCLTYRELWPYSFQDRKDRAVFAKVSGDTRKIDPSGKDGVLCEAAFALSQGQIQKAQNLVETALPENVRESAFYEMTADIWGSQRKYSRAVNYLKTVQNIESEWVKPYRMQGQFLTLMNRIPEALKAYQELLQVYSKHEIANIELGVLKYRFLGKLDEARQHIIYGLKQSDQLPPLIRVSGYKTLANIFLKESDKSKALEYFKLAYRHNPNDREIQQALSQLGAKDVLKKKKKKGVELLALAEHYERQGDCFAAQADYKAVFEADPTNARAAYKAALCVWKLSRTKEVVEWLNKAIKADPKYVEAYVKKAEYYAEKYDFQSSIRVLKRAVKINPKNYLIYQGFSRLHLARNDYDSALAYANKALKLYQTDVDSMILQIEALRGKGQNFYSKAYEKAVELRSFDPANPAVQETYIRSLALIQNLDSALSVTRQLIENYPYTIEYRYLYGKLLAEDERYEQAAELFTQVLRIDENHRAAMLSLGKALQAQGALGEARDLFLQAANQDASDPKAIFMLGELYLLAGKPKSALTQFSRVLKNNPLYPNAHFNAGKAALKVKDFEQALDQAKKEARLNPHRADPHILMGDIYFFIRDYANCIASYQKAIQLRPPTSDLYIKQARCYRLNGGLHTALLLLRTAELNEAGNPEVWKEMGAVCEMKEDIRCAVEAYRQYLTLYPNAPDRKVIEKRIGEILERR